MQANELVQRSLEESHISSSDSVISFEAKVPLDLKLAMQNFIESYPNWDQYRLIQAALAGFLVQNGMDSRELTRLYVGNMFRPHSCSKEN